MEFTDQNFDKEVLQAKKAVLVDFWATWCGPCKMMSPIIDELIKEYTGRPVKIGKLNVDESPKTAEKYEVMSIPTLIIFKNGQIKKRMVGLQEKTSLKKEIDTYV